MPLREMVLGRRRFLACGIQMPSMELAEEVLTTDAVTGRLMISMQFAAALTPARAKQAIQGKSERYSRTVWRWSYG